MAAKLWPLRHASCSACDWRSTRIALFAPIPHPNTRATPPAGQIPLAVRVIRSLLIRIPVDKEAGFCLAETLLVESGIKFPARPYPTAESYFAAYRDAIQAAWSSV